MFEDIEQFPACTWCYTAVCPANPHHAYALRTTLTLKDIADGAYCPGCRTEVTDIRPRRHPEKALRAEHAELAADHIAEVETELEDWYYDDEDF